MYEIVTSVLDAAIDGVVYASVDEVIQVPDVHARLNDLYMASCDPTDGRERRPRQSAPLTFLKADATKVDKRAERVRAADGTVRHVGDVPVGQPFSKGPDPPVLEEKENELLRAQNK